MTAVRGIESAHRFKTLLPRANAKAWFRGGEAGFAGTRAESFSLRGIWHDVSVKAFAASLGSPDQRGL